MPYSAEKIKTAIEQKNWSLVSYLFPSLSQGERESNYRKIIEDFRAGDFQQRWEMMKLFPGMGDRAIADLINILRGPEEDQQLRWFTVKILAGFEHPAVILALTELLDDGEEEEIKEIALQSLAGKGREVINIITPLLRENSTRIAAVKCLAVIPHPDIIEPLLTVVDDADVEVRRKAIEALGSFSDARLIPVMLKALIDGDGEVKKQAIGAIAYLAQNHPEIDWSEFIYPLIEDGEVGDLVAQTLGKIDTPNSVDKLGRSLKAYLSWRTKQKIVRALGWSRQPSALEYLREQLQEISTPSFLLQEIVRILGRNKEVIMRQKSTRILLNFYRARQESLSYQIKQSLAESWGELGEEEAISSLHKLSEDEDIRVRLHALAALKKIPTGSFL